MTGPFTDNRFWNSQFKNLEKTVYLSQEAKVILLWPLGIDKLFSLGFEIENSRICRL